MRIINRANRPLQWAAYRQDDGICSICLGDLWGTLQPGKDIDRGMGQDSVKLRVGTTGTHDDPIFSGPFVNTTSVVIGKNEKPVNMDDRANRYIARMQAGDAQKTRTRLEDLNATSRQMVSSARTIINALPAKLAIIKGLASLMMMMLVDEQRRPDPPSIDDISDAVAKVVSDDTARQQTAAILAAWHWLDENEARMGALQTAGKQPSPAEAANFDAGVASMLGPNSNFMQAMIRLQADETVRRRAMPAFLMGTGLHVKAKLIEVQKAALYRDLIREDYNGVLNFLTTNIQAIEKSAVALNDEYIRLLREYDIGPVPEMVSIASGFNIEAIGVAFGGDSPQHYLQMQVVELVKLRDSITALAHAVLG